MTRRWIWLFLVILISAFVTVSRYQSNIRYEHMRNVYKFHPIYREIILGLGAEIHDKARKDERTKTRSTTFHLEPCKEDYVLFEVGIKIKLPSVFLQKPFSEQEMKILYFDTVMTEWSRFHNTILFFKVSTAALFGQTEFAPLHRLLILMVPDGCSGLDTVDWSKVWDHDNLKTQTTAEG